MRKQNLFMNPNNNWVNLYVSNSGNIGDFQSSPSLYFPNITPQNFPNSRSYKNVIIGGGGLLRDGVYIKNVRQIINRSENVVLWGVGINNDDMGEINKYDDELKKCKLVGLRDCKTGFDWIPCASCMSNVFDDLEYIPSRKVVIYHHWSKPFEFNNIPSLSNKSFTKNAFLDVISFLNTGEYVITNTYHGMYWSLLLNKKVVLYKPFSNRFLNFKYIPPIINNIEQINDIDNFDYHIDDSLLEECRTLNKGFYERVMDI